MGNGNIKVSFKYRAYIQADHYESVISRFGKNRILLLLKTTAFHSLKMQVNNWSDKFQCVYWNENSLFLCYGWKNTGGMGEEKFIIVGLLVVSAYEEMQAGGEVWGGTRKQLVIEVQHLFSQYYSYQNRWNKTIREI